MFRKLKTIISMMIIAATLPLSAFANGTSGQSAGNVINMSDANPADNPPTATFNIQSATWSSGTEADHNCTWDGTILTLNDGANIAVTGTVDNGRRIEIAADAEAKLTLDGVSITNVGSNNPALLLHDGASLTLTLADASINTLAGGFNRAGIQVHAGRTLTINGTGTLNATGSSGAGIGGAAVDGMRDGGNITINGGTVFATGAGWNSGIGGGSGGNGGNITINGGIVTATGNNNGAGIGGGNNGNNGGAITINGGTVTATGHSGSAGIGGGHSGSGGTIIINDGTVNATGGDSGGAGIGGGASASGGNITINGGSVTATGNRQNLAWTNSGAGIGGGMSGAGGTITITGGTVRATSSREGGAGIGGGGGGSGVGGTVSITGGVVTATGSNGGAGIGGGGLGSNNPGPVNGTGTLGLNGNGVVFASSIHPTGANLTLTRGILFIGNNGTTYGNVVFTGSMTIRSGQTLTIQAPATLTNNGSIQNDGTIIGTVLGNAPFQVLDLSQATPTASTAWTFNNNVYTFLNGANVRVTGSNEGSERRIEIAANATATVTLDGATIAELDGGQSPLLLNNGANLTLTLAAGTINTLTAGNNRAGIQAPQGTTLTINGTGTLNARGGGSSAGIGGADIDGMRNGGVITISGGIVNATGGSNGAGIGGGFSGDGGNITINGGTVSATGGGSNAGAGIGGGLHGNGGTINITGGTVTASAIGTGIGAAGNASGSNTTITISGGAVNATGNGISGVGIGGGWTAGSGGNIVISGGTVVATGSNVGIGATGIGTFTLNGSNAFVSTNNFHAATTQTLTRGILHIGNNYTVYGAAAFTGDMTVQSGQTLTVMTGAALTNNGSIEILAGGTITNNGSITGNVVYFDTDIIDLGINRDYRAAGNGWTFENNVYTILHGATVTVTGNNGAGGRRIEIAENATAAVTLNGVTMFTRDANQSPLLLNAGAILNLTVTGTNYLTASGESAGAGIQVPEGTTITVNGTGTLYVKSDEGNGAGIGGGNTQSGGNITINSGTVDARGSGGGAGIGGGNGGNGGTVTINGGGVTAIGSFSGAGIGGGLNGTGGTVTITGGTVSASGGGAAGAGIGGGRHGDGGTINITGGTVTATGNNGGAGIGGGGRFAAGRDGDGAAVTITGGTVSATGHGGAGIGGGGADGAPGTFTLSGNAVVYATSVSDIDTTRRTQGILFIGNSGEVYGNVTLAADLTVGTGQSIIMRRGGSITVPANVTFTNNGTIYGFVFGTVIGSGTLIEPTANIDLSTAPAYNWGVGWDFANNVYTILDGANVTVTGSNAGSERRIEIAANATATVTLNGVSITGLGDNQSPLLLNNGANLTLILEGGTTNTLTAGNNRAGVQAPQGTTLTINGTGTFNVTGGVGGAGIGGGAGGAGGTITINGGTINATGGSSGAGIGGGAFGSGGIIAISGGTVIATRGAGGAGIGGGVDGAAGTFTLNGNAVVFASSVSDTK